MIQFEIWRDVDPERMQVGFALWATGGEVYLGRRLYRWAYRPARALPPEQPEGAGPARSWADITEFDAVEDHDEDHDEDYAEELLPSPSEASEPDAGGGPHSTPSEPQEATQEMQATPYGVARDGIYPVR